MPGIDDTGIENVARRNIAFYRLLGMSGFYSLSYLLRPARILHLIMNYRANSSDTVLEEMLFALLRMGRIHCNC